MQQLSNIASVFCGISYPQKLDLNGDAFPVIRMGDISETGISEDTQFYKLKKFKDFYFLREGDILLSRDLNLYQISAKDVEVPIIAGHVFWVIRPKINSNYLFWYLNLPAIQFKLKAMSEGTNATILKKDDLMSLKIEIPDDNKIQHISEAYSLLIKQKQLLKQQLAAVDKMSQGLVQAL